MKKKYILFTILFVLISFTLFKYFYPGDKNSVEKHDFNIMAHRGAHVMWDKTKYDLATGCEATHIYKPTEKQTYIENTIESIKRAFDLGANMVEIDIRSSKDNILMISHEINLECKTDGKGKISDYTVEELKKLDVGYGFTYDGEHYPYRGKGIGKMPTLEDVLNTFPDKKFLIDHKDGTKETADLLIAEIKKLPQERRSNIFYWGPPEMGTYINQNIPEVKRLLVSRGEMKTCVINYELSFGETFGKECKGLALGMNREYAKYLWGWPYNFIKKAQENNSLVFLMVDNEKDFQWAKDLPVDGIITDYIEDIAPKYVQ
ncbi:hypothetical protein M0R01_01750 [bacterium]|nr:hypothetical protein [bacterium]